MNLITMLSAVDEVTSLLEKLKSWVQDNYGNPLLWLGFFILGIFVFESTYSALQKEK